MSVIRTSSIAYGGKVEVYCSSCDSKVGVFTVAEVKELMRAGVNVLCFGCDGLDADKVPPVLRLAEEEYLLVIGDQPFLADWKVDRHSLQEISWETWMTLVSGYKPEDSLFLSSSTKVHANGQTDEK